MDNNNKCAVVNCNKPVKHYLMTEGLLGVILSVPLCKQHYDEHTSAPDESESKV